MMLWQSDSTSLTLCSVSRPFSIGMTSFYQGDLSESPLGLARQGHVTLFGAGPGAGEALP